MGGNCSAVINGNCFEVVNKEIRLLTILAFSSNSGETFVLQYLSLVNSDKGNSELSGKPAVSLPTKPSVKAEAIGPHTVLEFPSMSHEEVFSNSNECLNSGWANDLRRKQLHIIDNNREQMT